MTEEHYLSLDDIRAIPSTDYPFLVFADRLRGFFSWGVKVRTKSFYGHFMWLTGPDEMVSQSWGYKAHPVQDFQDYALKLVNNPAWTAYERQRLIDAIRKDLALPWYQNTYDWVGIIGEALGFKLINLPNRYYCSERSYYLSLVDPEYCLRHPNPSQVNNWTKQRDRYKVFGRYSPD